MSRLIYFCFDCDRRFIPALPKQTVCEPCRAEAYRRTIPYVASLCRGKTFPSPKSVTLFEEIEEATDFSEAVLGAWNRLEMEAAHG